VTLIAKLESALSRLRFKRCAESKRGAPGRFKVQHRTKGLMSNFLSRASFFSSAVLYGRNTLTFGTKSNQALV